MSITPGEIRRRWDDGVKSVRKEINDYRLNDFFIEGEQWVYPNASTHRIEEFARRDPERTRLTVNMMRKSERTIMGVLHSRPLFFQITPTAADAQTVAAARLGIQVLDNYSSIQGWETIRRDLDQVVFRGGTGALALEWDPEAGDPIGDGTKHTGDLVLSALSMGEFVVEAGARDAERARYWIKALAVPVEQAKADWGLKDTPKADSQWTSSPMQRRGDPDQKHLCTVFTYYERPHRDSDGQMVVMLGDERVDEGEWPFPFKDRLNIGVATETPKHSKWYGSTVVTDARSPQVALNMAQSSIVEHLKNAGNARTWVAWEDWDRINELTDTPGEFVPYNGTVLPKVVSPGQMPSWWERMPDRFAAVIDTQLGSTEVLAGIAPRNVESGYGIGILSDNAQGPLSRMIDESARVWGTIATLGLRVVEANVTETRSGAYVNDPSDLPEEFSWTGKALRGQTTVKVPKEAIAPRSRAQVEAWAQSAFAGGHITLWQMLRLTEVPALPSEREILDPDSEKQDRENRRMARGEQIEPKPFDDHAKHLATLNMFRKSETFEGLDEEVQALFELHAVLHDVMAAQDAAKDARRQATDPNLAAAPNAQATPGSVPLDPGAEDGNDDLDLAGGSQPLDAGLEGIGGGPGPEVGGGLPLGGFPA